MSTSRPILTASVEPVRRRGVLRMSTGAHATVRELYNALDLHRTIDFDGHDVDLGPAELQPLPASCYVADLHKDGADNPRAALRRAIQLSASASHYFFTGMRGSGKSTELLRLKQELEQTGEFVVLYSDMTEYLPMHAPVEVGDFLITVLSALADEVDDYLARQGLRTVKDQPVAQRFWNFLQTEVTLDSIDWGVSSPVGKFGLKLRLKENLQFKKALQDATRKRLDRVVEEARAFVSGLVKLVRDARKQPDLRVVLLVDSVERLQGVGDEARRVFDSVENLFGAHRDKLRFSLLSVVYSVPPYITAATQAGEGNRVFSLPLVPVFEHPLPGAHGTPRHSGVLRMLRVLDKRSQHWRMFFTEDGMTNLALASGGDLREWFLLIRESLNSTDDEKEHAFPVQADVIEQVKRLRRNQFGFIPEDQLGWLARVVATHQHGLPSQDKLATLAALFDGKLIYQYRNGDDWYDVHPLLWDRVSTHAALASEQ